MPVIVLSFVRVESSAEYDKYRIEFQQDNEAKEVYVTIFKDEVRVMRRGELDAAIGMARASSVCRQLISFVDGNEVDLPFTIQEPAKEK